MTLNMNKEIQPPHHFGSVKQIETPKYRSVKHAAFEQPADSANRPSEKFATLPLSESGIHGEEKAPDIQRVMATEEMQDRLLDEARTVVRTKVEAGLDPNTLLENYAHELDDVNDAIDSLDSEYRQDAIERDLNNRKMRLETQIGWLRNHLETN